MKNKKLVLRLSVAEKESLKINALKHDTTISNYVRCLLFDKKISIRCLPDLETEQLKTALNKIGINLWQLMKQRKVFNLTDTINLKDYLFAINQTLHKINDYYDSKSNNE